MEEEIEKQETTPGPEVEVANEIQPDEPAETEELTPTGRERWKARLQEYDPEGAYDEDEDFYNGLDRYAAERDNKLASYKDLEGRLQSAIDADPRSGQFICNLLDKVDFVDNLLEVLGPELQDVLDSPEAKAKYDEARKTAQETAAARQANESATIDNYESWAADKDEEKLAEFGDRILEIFEQAKEGLLTVETLEALWKGLNYDTDIAEATDNARIQGRNERIMAKIQTADSGDGVPSLASAAAMRRQPQAQQRQRKSIWDNE